MEGGIDIDDHPTVVEPKMVDQLPDAESTGSIHDLILLKGFNIVIYRGIDKGVRRLSEVAHGAPHAKPWIKNLGRLGVQTIQLGINAGVVFPELHYQLYAECPGNVS